VDKEYKTLKGGSEKAAQDIIQGYIRQIGRDVRMKKIPGL
jgi:hypothetical protein